MSNSNLQPDVARLTSAQADALREAGLLGGEADYGDVLIVSPKMHRLLTEAQEPAPVRDARTDFRSSWLCELAVLT